MTTRRGFLVAGASVASAAAAATAAIADPFTVDPAEICYPKPVCGPDHGSGTLWVQIEGQS